MRRRAMGALAFGAAAAGSMALGYAAKRRAVAGIEPAAGSEWAELHKPVHGTPLRVASFDGTGLHAEVLGAAGAPTLVFAHGYGLSQHAWHYQRRDLRERFRLVCYDQRGHGTSELARSGDYSMRALGRDLAAVLDAAAPAGQPTILVGHSLGGMTVLSMAEQVPERIRELAGVVLMSTAGGSVVAGGAFTAGAATLSTLGGRVRGWRRTSRSSSEAVAARTSRSSSEAVAARTSRSSSEAVAAPTSRSSSEAAGYGDPEAWTDEPHADTLFLLTRALGLSPDADPAHVAFTEQLLRQAPGRVKAALGPALTSLRLGHVAGRLDLPGLVLVGEADRLTPTRQARRLAEAMPRGRLHVVPGAGHMLPLEAHEVVNGELGAFVDAVTA